MEFKDRLRDLRQSHNLTQDEFSKQSNIGRSVIGMYETGRRKPSFETLETIADFFNVTIDYLTGKTDNPKPPVNAITEDDFVALIAATHRKIREKHKDDLDSPEYADDLKAANYYFGNMFEGIGSHLKIHPIMVTDPIEQLLLLRYRTLDKKSQEELTKRADELCTLYSLNVNMEKVHTISDLLKANKKNTAPE